MRLWYRTVCSTLSICLIYLHSSSFVAYFDKIRSPRSPGLSTGVALRSICGVGGDVGAYGALLIIVCIIWVGRLPSAVVGACWLGVCMDWHMCPRAVRVMLRIARRALVAPCTALRYIGNRNGSEITTMCGKQSRGWIDLFLRPLAVNKSTSMTWPGAARALSSLLTLVFDSKRT